MLLSRSVRMERSAQYYYDLGRKAFMENFPRHSGDYLLPEYRNEFCRGWDDASIPSWDNHFNKPRITSKIS